MDNKKIINELRQEDWEKINGGNELAASDLKEYYNEYRDLAFDGTVINPWVKPTKPKGSVKN